MGRRCAVGAINSATETLDFDIVPMLIARKSMLSIAIDRGFKTIELMNDSSSYELVLSAFDEAIENVKGT